MHVLATCRNGGTGRRARFRSVWEQSRGGSSPLFGTVLYNMQLCPDGETGRHAILRG